MNQNNSYSPGYHSPITVNESNIPMEDKSFDPGAHMTSNGTLWIHNSDHARVFETSKSIGQVQRSMLYPYE